MSAWRRRPSDPPALPALKLLLVQAEGLLLQSWRGKNQERKRSGAGLVSAALAGSTWLAAGSSERLGVGLELLHARHCLARLSPCSTTPRAAPLCGTTWDFLLVPRWLCKAVKAHPRPQKSPPRLEFDTIPAGGRELALPGLLLKQERGLCLHCFGGWCDQTPRAPPCVSAGTSSLLRAVLRVVIT